MNFNCEVCVLKRLSSRFLVCNGLKGANELADDAIKRSDKTADGTV